MDFYSKTFDEFTVWYIFNTGLMGIPIHHAGSRNYHSVLKMLMYMLWINGNASDKNTYIADEYV